MKILNLFKKILSIPKKFLIIGLIVIALVGFFVYKSHVSNTPKLQFASVKKQDIRSIVSSSGTLTGKDSANLKFQSGGTLSFINVKAGDVTRAYQVVAGLDTVKLTAALQQAKNTFVAADAAAKKAEDDVKSHDSDETFTQKQTRTAAQVTRDNAFDSIKAAQKALDDSILVSPIAGTVTSAIQVAGQNVSTADIIAQVVDISSVYFDTDLDESDIGKISLGLPAEVSLDAYPDQIFKGKVEQILPQTKTTLSGATVVTVRIKLDNSPTNFVNGLSGSSSIITNTSSNTLTLPIEALKDGNIVEISQGGKLESKKVVTGISSDTDVEIKEGLAEGEQVVLNPK